MLKSFKYRIRPTKNQANLINKHLDSCRFIYNLALETKQQAYAGNRVNISCYDLCKQLPGLKEEYVWLKEINGQSLQQSIMNMETSFVRFFKGKSDFPKFKKKNGRQSFNVPQNLFFRDGKLVIPKFKEGIIVVKHREIEGTIKQATITRTSTGKYFASILTENDKAFPKKHSIIPSTTLGIDLGIKSFLTTSKGEKIHNHSFLKKSLSKLKFIQGRCSKYKGKRTKNKLARIHEIIYNQRMDFLNKASKMLVRDNQTIAIEDLNIIGMIKNHKLSQSITDVAWGEFIRQLRYKSDWYGINIIQIGRFEPSSKTCSVCGCINKELNLREREWNCKSCNTILDRDINAAVNIKNFALKSNLSVERRLKNREELPTIVGAETSEALLPSGN